MLEKIPDFVGHALREQRAGLDKTVFLRTPLRTGQAAIRVTSLAFVDHGPLPVTCTADGDGLSPPLQWSNLPPGTRSVALIVEDADSPTPQPLVHAIATGLAPEDAFLREGALDDESPLPETPGRDALVAVIEGHAIASGCLIGTYERHDTSVKAGEAAVDQGAALA